MVNLEPPSDADKAHWDAVEEASELMHEEQYHKALIELRRTLEEDRKNPYAFYLLGVALYEIGELEAARDAYRAALAVAPSHLGARVHLSHVLRELGDARGAVKEGSHALSMSPGDADALHAIGLAYLAEGEHVPARKYLEAFLEARPEFEAATEVRALLASFKNAKRSPTRA